MEFSVLYIWRSPEFDVVQWVELFYLEIVATENRRTWVNQLHKSTSPQDYEYPEVWNCVLFLGVMIIDTQWLF